MDLRPFYLIFAQLFFKNKPMRKIFGIGETILDIIFRNGQPRAAVPGGSSFNAIISLGRAGLNTTFLSETGDDRVGQCIIYFMKQSHVNAHYMIVPKGSKSPISLAFLNENNDAEYIFYKDHEHDCAKFDCPVVYPNDIVLFGSYYAVNPVIRDRVGGFLHYAAEQGAILYYDVNFRRPHAAEIDKLMPAIEDNLRLSTVVRGSSEDFSLLYGINNIEQVYEEKIADRCPNFICTDGSHDIRVQDRGSVYRYPVHRIPTVSTIGAGDNFNAGFIYGLVKYGLKKEDLQHLDSEGWKRLIASGQRFSEKVCQSVDNYIDMETGERLHQEMLKDL
jgi:fructokinase